MVTCTNACRIIILTNYDYRLQAIIIVGGGGGGGGEQTEKLRNKHVWVDSDS